LSSVGSTTAIVQRCTPV